MHDADHPHDYADGQLPPAQPGACWVCPKCEQEVVGGLHNHQPVDGRVGFEHIVCPTTHDAVDHPDHYTAGGIECIDALEAALTDEQFAGFCRGNALKYLWRAGRKGDVVEDLRKASWYVDREIGARA